MKISTVYLARYVNEDKMTSYVTFNFGKLIDVSVEVESYRFLNMVAEIGGKIQKEIENPQSFLFENVFRISRADFRSVFA